MRSMRAISSWRRAGSWIESREQGKEKKEGRRVEALYCEQHDCDKRQKDAEGLQPGEAFLENDPCQQDGGGRIQRAQYGCDVDSSRLGGEDVEGVAADVEHTVEDRYPPQVARRQGRLAGDQCEKPQRSEPGKAGRSKRPEESIEGGAVEGEEIHAKEKAGEQRQAQVCESEAPVDRLGLRDRPDCGERQREAGESGGGRDAQREETEDHRD